MGDITFPNFKLQYKAVIIKIACYWNKERPAEQSNRKRNSKIDTQLYYWLIFDKAVKNKKWGKESHFSKYYWGNWSALCRTMNLDFFLTLSQK